VNDDPNDIPEAPVSPQRPDPVNDAAAVREATARLLEEAAALGPAAVAEPSRLPGWTRGHVLTHLARNADALVNLLTWARTGEETPMYDDADARDREIETGAGRPLAEQLADLRAAADRFDAAAGALPPQAWATQVSLRGGAVLPAAAIPGRRLTEIQLHRVDLDAGSGFADLPAEWVDRELDHVLDRLTGQEGVAAVRLHDTGSGETWVIGAADRAEVTVAGTAAALLAWVTGRGDGHDLVADPALPLPVLPPLG
jgi:maleylpyruvate isomerase